MQKEEQVKRLNIFRVEGERGEEYPLLMQGVFNSSTNWSRQRKGAEKIEPLSLFEWCQEKWGKPSAVEPGNAASNRKLRKEHYPKGYM